MTGAAPATVPIEEACRVLVDASLEAANAIALLRDAYVEIGRLKGAIGAYVSADDACNAFFRRHLDVGVLDARADGQISEEHRGEWVRLVREMREAQRAVFAIGRELGSSTGTGR